MDSNTHLMPHQAVTNTENTFGVTFFSCLNVSAFFILCLAWALPFMFASAQVHRAHFVRSEERRVGKEC
jgi:hypothetical protein